jgi:hypothetical protein
MNHYPLARTTDVVVQTLDAEVLIYDLGTNKAHCLNETSAAVYQACDGKTSVSEISFLLSKQLKSLVTEDFVWLALDGLKKENLIENESEVSTPFEGLSRREVIRKVGLASMIALPVISSLIAPPAAHAQSGGANGATCTANANCASSCCASNTCVAARTVANGGSCSNSCQCSAIGGVCNNGTCASRIVAQ